MSLSLARAEGNVLDSSNMNLLVAHIGLKLSLFRPEGAVGHEPPRLA